MADPIRDLSMTSRETRFWRRFGKNVAKARMDAGVTQEKLAKKIGLSRPSLVNIEQGRQRVTLWTATKIALHVQVWLEDLLDD